MQQSCKSYLRVLNDVIIYLYFTNLMVASTYAKKYINKCNTTTKNEKEKKKTRT